MSIKKQETFIINCDYCISNCKRIVVEYNVFHDGIVLSPLNFNGRFSEEYLPEGWKYKADLDETYKGINPFVFNNNPYIASNFAKDYSKIYCPTCVEKYIREINIKNIIE